MKEQLEGIKIIIETFIKKHKIILAYLEIKHCAQYNVHCAFKLKAGCGAFDNKTGVETRNLLSELNTKIVLYMKNNKITKPVYIKTFKRGWATSGIRIYTKEGIEF